jgi:hypothetical protein
MSRWKQLPVSLDPRVRQLAVHLRRVKDHSGLGLRTLATRTGYSRSSWDRYLNGRALPPQQAVEALARACGLDPARLLALHEVAVAAGADTAGPDTAGPEGCSGRPGPAPAARSDAPAGGPHRRGTAGVVAAIVLAVVAAGVAAAVLVAAPWDHGGPGKGPPAAAGASAAGDTARGPFVFRPGKNYPCRVHRAGNGLLYAGYDTTRTALIGLGSAQWSVVEAQCLLRRHGFAPGIADGMYGARTERAVKRLQDAAHIVVDGVVGEDTWGVLRK